MMSYSLVIPNALLTDHLAPISMSADIVWIDDCIDANTLGFVSSTTIDPNTAAANWAQILLAFRSAFQGRSIARIGAELSLRTSSVASNSIIPAPIHNSHHTALQEQPAFHAEATYQEQSTLQDEVTHQEEPVLQGDQLTEVIPPNNRKSTAALRELLEKLAARASKLIPHDFVPREIQIYEYASTFSTNCPRELAYYESYFGTRSVFTSAIPLGAHTLDLPSFVTSHKQRVSFIPRTKTPNFTVLCLRC